MPLRGRCEGVTREQITAAQRAGAKWFNTHPNGASKDHEWADFYRYVLDAARLIDCPRCHGEGEIGFNPSRSVPKDPQLEDSARCPECHGDGVLPVGELLERVREDLELMAEGMAQPSTVVPVTREDFAA